MVEEFGSRIYFELKDREFGLGDSYPFAHRIDRYGGTVGVVATMDKVSADAQKYFKDISQRREYPISVRYLERREGIQDGIRQLVEDRSKAQARRVFQPFSSQLGFDVWPLVEVWIDNRMRARVQ
jgi:hypothetical protein